jgi:rhodanese-related sulfurtransferase
MSELSNSTTCQQIAPAELQGHAGQTVLLDVRSPIEFETEHIPDSINVPLNELEARCEEVPRQGQLVVICRSGKRAERGAYALLGRGFQPKVLEGGMVAWRKAGLPGPFKWKVHARLRHRPQDRRALRLVQGPDHRSRPHGSRRRALRLEAAHQLRWFKDQPDGVRVKTNTLVNSFRRKVEGCLEVATHQTHSNM